MKAGIAAVRLLRIRQQGGTLDASVEPGQEEEGYGEGIAAVFGKSRCYALSSCAYDV